MTDTTMLIAAAQGDAAVFKARAEAAEKALATFMYEWDSYGENEHGYSDHVADVMNDAWKNGFIDLARASLGAVEPQQ